MAWPPSRLAKSGRAVLQQRNVAIIGSFRQHYAQVQHTCNLLRAAGISVTSPLGSNIIEENIPFVRFTTDNAEWSDAAIQSQALHRILRADLVYVVAPDGYLGRTTCYEIGRVMQARKPLYFSSFPDDLPLYVPPDFVMDAEVLVKKLCGADWTPEWIYGNTHGQVGTLERELLEGSYRND